VKQTAALLIVLAFTAVARGQDVDLPAKIEAKANRLTPIEIKNPPAKIAWQVVPPTDIDIFREYDPDSKSIKLRFLAYREGTFYLVVASANGTVKQKVCVIVVGTPPPEPGPDPPKPPDPPPVPPDAFTAKVLAAWAKEPAGDRNKIKTYAAHYAAASKAMRDPRFLTTGDVWRTLSIARAKVMEDSANHKYLAQLSNVIGEELNVSMPYTDTTVLTDALRKHMEAELLRISKALEACK
jgi:hypothetical protein